MPRPKSDSEQINLTLPSAWLEQANQYAGWLSRPGMTVGRSDVLRMALAAGMEHVRAEAEKAKAERAAKKR